MSVPTLTGRVIYKGQPGYDTARLDMNTRFSIFPNVIVYCGNETDVANAIGYARGNHLPLSIRSGGHDYEAFSLAEGGVVIDVSPMNGITLDTANGKAVIQAGANLLPMYETLWQQRVTVPGGTCGTVGISGLTLGGGFGLLSRNHGLTCDSLLELRMVNADGQILTANPTQNPDLFWACCGGGNGNFGVVTSLTFRTHSIGDVTLYYIQWPWTALHDVVKAWQAWAPTIDKELTCVLALPAKSSGQQLSSTGMYVGTKDLKTLIKPLTSVSGFNHENVWTTPYIDAVRNLAGATKGMEHLQIHKTGPATNNLFKNTSSFAFQPISDAGINAIGAALQSAPSPQNELQLDSYGGAVAQIAPQATAFPHRAARFSLQYKSSWQTPGEQQANINWIDTFRQTMQSYVSPAAYRNYTDADIQFWQHAYYGNNLDRLVQVKAQYDPHDVFHFRQSLPTSRAARTAPHAPSTPA